MSIDPQERAAFTAEVKAWFDENSPEDPGFLLPQSFMEVGTDQQFEFLKAWQRKVYDAGYLGMAWPKEYGGHSKPQWMQDIVTAEMTKRKLPFMVNTIGLNWAGPLILNMGSEEQKKAYIKGILTADDIWCQGFSEPDHGSDLGNAQLKAEKDGNEYVLNGSKIWTSLGAHAKYMILLARTDQGAPNKYAGLSFFLIPMKIDGIDPVPIKKMTGEYGFCQTFFDDARIAPSCLIGEEGGGWQVAMATLAFERGAAGGQAGGHSMNSQSVHEVVDLARRVKKNGKPAIDDPLVRQQLAQFVIDQKGLHLNGARAKHKPLTEDRPAAVPLMGKLLGSEFQRRMNEFAILLLGQNANYYVGDEDAIDGGLWTRSYLNSFSATIGGGTTQVQKNILGERVLGLPKS